jgi:hypothetical protein
VIGASVWTFGSDRDGAVTAIKRHVPFPLRLEVGCAKAGAKDAGSVMSDYETGFVPLIASSKRWQQGMRT